MEERHYRIAWSSVDGAGSEDTPIAEEETAIQQANAEQGCAEINGNPWGYSYKVWRHDGSRVDTIYNARTGEHYR